MNFRKLIFIINCFFLVGTTNIIVAQNAILSGYVLNLNTNLGIPNHLVEISSHADTINGTGINYYNNLFTYQNGYFIDSVSIPSGQTIAFYIKVKDCMNNMFVDTIYSNSTTPKIFHICDTNSILCYSQFVAYPDTSNHKLINFANLSSANTDIYSWTFGDGSTSSSSNPTHLYNYNSTYQVCLTATDTSTNCTQIFCDTLHISPSQGCSNNFTHSVNNLTVSFFGSCSSTLPTIYKWDFGDQQTASGQNPVHQYLNSGIFNVCLKTISINPVSLDTCMTTMCNLIGVNTPSIGNMYGQIFGDNSMVHHGRVFLFKLNTSNNRYQIVDTTIIKTNDTLGISYYYFQNKPYGTYLTQAELSHNDTLFGEFAPTYYGNTYRWSSATPINHFSPAGNYPINLSKINHPNGTCSVSGRILSAEKGFGDPIPQIKVYLYDSQFQLYGFMVTNQNGEYMFNNLELQVYYVHVEVINEPIMPTYIYPQTANTNLQNIDIFIGHFNGISNQEVNNFKLNIYPTLVENYLTAEIISNSSCESTIEIYSMNGSLSLSQNFKIYEGSNKFELDLSHLQSGVFFLKINLCGQSLNRKIIKINN